MLSATINNLISDLKPRHREIIAGRFGLADNDRKTLAGLGAKYDITRERVRQIEAEALSKIKDEAKRERLNEILEYIFNHLDGLGGLRREDILIQELKSLLRDNNLHGWHLKFLAEVVEKPHYHPENDEFHNFWYADDDTLRLLKKFVNHLERVIAAKKDELLLEGKFKDYLNQVIKRYELSEPVGLNYISVSRKFKTNPFGDFGLSSWEEIDPKTIGSKTYLVIKKTGKPLHFREVAELINEMNFDSKKALPQTVHNELIKDQRFVLVGRGIYGLREQGYAPGTAKEVIRQVLRKEGPLQMDKIIDLVGKQRFLEKNTILLNLQNKKLFRRLSDGRYAILRGSAGNFR